MRFKKYIVMNPPSPPGYVSNKDSMGGFGQLYPVGATYFPPLDLVYLASYLVEKGIHPEILECLGLEITREELVHKLQKISAVYSDNEAAAVIIVRTSVPTLDWDLSVCRDIKDSAANVRIAIYSPIIPHVMDRIKQEQCIDYIVKGEPEETVFELITGRPESEIRGLTFRKDVWVQNEDRPLFKNLDEMPFPKWDLFPYKMYQLPKSSTKSEALFLPMLTSRGCPFGCNYCPYPLGQGTTWRSRSPLNVVDEIDHLTGKMGVEYIIFRDPIFSFSQKRVVQICRGIIKRGLKFKWRCETRVDCLSEETLRAMAEAGCEGINFGIESPDVKIQEKSGRKPIDKDLFLKTVLMCRQLGVKTFCFFIIGLPGDTSESIFETIEFAMEARPNWVQFTAASPFIGTEFRQWALDNALITEEDCSYINSHSVYMGNENLSKAQIEKLFSLAKFIQNYLINRKGILKDDTRQGILYQGAKAAADILFDLIGKVLFHTRKYQLEKSL
jgi:radical SAM superfamily enzyme YgiQ (UPF0313 family)